MDVPNKLLGCVCIVSIICIVAVCRQRVFAVCESTMKNLMTSLSTSARTGKSLSTRLYQVLLGIPKWA